ncbi:MAG: hypothetical protein GX200_01675 [Firmicutes bacterium]|nr:hypothetical protein [Bacillota bacterium]
MSKLESIFICAIIGPVLPILFFLAGWWASFKFVPEQIVFVFSLLGLAGGCILDIVFSKQIISAYRWKRGILAIIYLFYSVCFLGFFMGVPVFNLAVGALAGVFMGRSFYHEGMAKEQLQKSSASLALFSALVMALVAIASAYFATKDILDTALNLRGMLKLPFLPTKQMIIALIVIGGTGLILAQYWITKKLTRWAYRIGQD